jgi:hypothetical protein
MDAVNHPQTTQTARERLAQTRRELLRGMGQHASQGAGEPAPDGDGHPASSWPQEAKDARHENQASSGGSGLRQGLRAWWRAQPAHLALELGQPLFEKYARAHPLKVLVLSAGAGAVLVLARPWRLISVTGMLVAALKSTELSALASDVLRSPRAQRPGRPH